jgi:DNA-binding winged helix-turn-helix (wHTH) protein
MSAGHKILRFGAFQFDTRQQELSQRGLPIRMPASQIRLLTLLLERPQQLISRDDITQRLWTEPSSVDISSGINTAVNRLRGYLVDSSTNPIYIETVVGLGYRFIADVSVEDLDVAPTIDHPVDPIDSVPVVHAARPRRLWRLGAVAVTVSALALAGAGVWWHHSLTKTHPDSPMALQLTMVTLDDDDNKLTADAVSPDGKMTAYADSTGVLVHSQDRLVRRWAETVRECRGQRFSSAAMVPFLEPPAPRSLIGGRRDGDALAGWKSHSILPQIRP